jgi:hypothetical protein
MFARAASLGPMNPVLSAFLADAGVSAPTKGGLLGARPFLERFAALPCQNW